MCLLIPLPLICAFWDILLRILRNLQINFVIKHLRYETNEGALFYACDAKNLKDFSIFIRLLDKPQKIVKNNQVPEVYQVTNHIAEPDKLHPFNY